MSDNCICDIETGNFAIKYDGGSYQGSQFIQPIAVGRLKDGTKVLVCRTTSTSRIKTLDWNKISNVRRPSKAPVLIKRPSEYLAKLKYIDQEGIPMEWLSHSKMPQERINGYDPDTKVVDTIPYEIALHQT